MRICKSDKLLTALLCLLLTVSCEKDKNDSTDLDYSKYKLVAWNSLTPSEQAIVTHEWNDAEAMLTTNPDNITDRVVLVVFHTTMEILTCPINVYVDYENREVIYPDNIMLCD